MESNGQRLRHEQQQESEESLNQSGTTQIRIYDSVEGLLREDADRNPPPASLSHRVAESTTKDAAVDEKPWWKRLLGQ